MVNRIAGNSELSVVYRVSSAATGKTKVKVKPLQFQLIIFSVQPFFGIRKAYFKITAVRQKLYF